jgi:short-subunit dehydrogenase involved in D-alanine esterification of teichoic acids
MALNFQQQFSRAAAHYDHQSEPAAEISDEAFQDACGDVALAMDSDDLGELVNILAEAAPALALIANTTGFANAYNLQLRELLSKCESIRAQVEEQARVMA